MAKTALTQLQEQIEAVRREAFAAGYAAAMQSVRDFAARPESVREPAAAPPRRRSSDADAPSPVAPPGQRRPRRSGKASRGARRLPGARPQRGTNARFVEEVLHSNAPRALRPAEIRSAIERDKGVAIAFTSIRHALGQLEGRRIAEQVADSKTWRYRDGTASD